MGNAFYTLSAGLEFFFAVISVILLIGCLLDHDRKRAVNRIMIAILIVHAIMNAVDACLWLWCDVRGLLALMKALSFLSYALGCAIFAMFSYLIVGYIREYRPVSRWITRGILALAAVMALLWVLSLFNGMYYYWDENGVCRIGELYFLSQVFGVIYLVFNIALVVFSRRALRKKDCATLILYNLIPLISFGFTYYWDVLPVYCASTLSLLIYYIIIHVEHGQRSAEQKALLLRQELELVNSRTAVVLTQVKPHFLYNTLTAIAQLCEKDPKKAQETTLRFSEYMRRNMDCLEQLELIPFEKELEHIKTYLSIEQVRFGEALHIEYDIKAADFLLPPLCLQPLVENAVKHGVGMKEDGGTVTIRSQELAEHFEITISDDGVGFDVNQPPRDGKAHIGIKNTKERLEKLIRADMSVKSGVDAGTVVTIQIPRTGAKNADICGG